MGSSNRPPSAPPPPNLGAQLALAAEANRPHQIERLIRQGAQGFEGPGADALTLAAALGHAECVRLLIPVSRPAERHSAPLRSAAEHGHPHCLALLLPVSDPMANETASDDSSALTRAAARGHAECVKLLLPFCDARAAHSRALSCAAAAGSSECVALLLPLSDPSARSFESLRLAFSRGRSDCADLLIHAAAPPEPVAIALMELAAARGHWPARAIALSYVEALRLREALPASPLPQARARRV